MKKQFQSKAVPRGTRTIWRYLGALFILFTFAIGNVWGADPTLSFGTTSVTTSTFLKEYSTEGITISSDRSYSSNCVELGSTPSSYTTYYLQVLSASAAIDSIHVLMSGNGSNKNLRSPMFGWATEANSATADTYSFPAAQTTTGNGYTYAKWFKFDLTGASVKCARLFRASKNVSSKTPEYTGSSTALGSGNTIKIYGMKIWLHPAAKTDPTITFNDGAYTVGGALDLSTLFDSNSDGAVTYTVKTDGGTSASIVGTSFSASAAGTAVVTASQAATSTFNAATKDANIVVSVPSTPTHSISYTNLKGSDVSTYPTEYYEGTGIASFAPLADVADFHFTGWDPASISDTEDQDVEVEAQWVDAYNVSFDAGAGSGTVPASFQKWEGAKFNLPGQGSMTAPAGKAFDGWKANGTGDKLAANAEYTMGAAEVEFVAQWKTMPTTIFHWRSNTGTITMDATNGTTTGGTTTLRTADSGKTWGNESASYHSSVASDMQGETSGKELKPGGNAAYLELTLTSGTFQEGDTIFATGYNEWAFLTSKTDIGTVTTFDVVSFATGTAKDNNNVKTGYGIIGSGVNASTIYARRKNGSSSGIAAIKVIRPAARDIASTEITLSDLKVNNRSISSDSLDILKTPEAYALTLGDEFVTAPEIKFNEHKVITYADELLPATKETDKVYTVTATLVDGNWQAQATINAITYTVTAPKQSSAKVTYYDGTTKIGEETVAIGGHPAEYASHQGKDYATFVAWYNNSDLADEHKITNIAELEVNEATNVYGKWAPAYASSINIEKWVLDNGVSNSPFRAELTARHYKYATLNNLDSLNDDPSKDYRNYAYLGQKVNKTDSEISFLLKNGSNLKVRFGHLGSTINVVYGTDDPIALTSAEYANESPAGDKVYEYTATADVIVKFQCTGTSTSVFKQIMIDEPIANVVLPAIVTLDANGGTYADASVKYTGTALVIGDATPADEYHVFAGWFDGDDQIVATAYVPTKNVTLQAHYAPKPYSVTYMPNGGSGAEFITDDNATEVAEGTLFTAPASSAFVEWNTQADGNGDAYAPGDAVIKNLTLFAQWETSYTVTFDMQEHGAAIDPQNIVSGGKVTKPADPSESGWDFGGWYKESTCENEWDFATDVVTTTTTIFAKWTADPCPSPYSLSKVVLTSASDGTVTGYNNNEYAGEKVIGGLSGTQTAEVDPSHEGTETGYKLNSGGSAIVFATLKKGTFQVGDRVVVTITKAQDAYKVEEVIQPILDIYYGTDKNDATLLTTIENVTAAGSYTYRLTAADVTAIGSKKGIGVFRPSSGRTQNPYVYSVEIKGCREWAIFHTLTFKNIDGTATIAAESLEEGAYASTVAPAAPKIAMKRFLGWAEAIDGTPVELTSYTITEDKILYAVYEDIVCPTTGTVYKFQLKTDLTNGNIFTSAPGELTLNTTDHLSSMVNGEVTVNLASGKNTNRVQFYDGKAIGFANGDGASITLTLDCALATGDEIRFINYAGNGNKMNLSDGTHSLELNGNNAETVQKITVNSDWNGADELTLTRGGNTPKLTYFEIYRPAKYDVSFNMMGHGTQIADIKDVIDGSKISAPTAPTDANYSFAGWYKENTLANEWKFDVDVVEANTTLYAKWLDKSDATLKSLMYGAEEITLQAGVYTYNVTLPAFTSAVPALTAETSNPNATKVISNAAAFDSEGNATSTVTVTPEVGADQVYTVNFAKGVLIPLQEVTGSITWNFANAVTANVNITGTPQVLANYGGVTNDNTFESDKLEASGEKFTAGSKANLRANYIHFHTTVPGMLTISYSNTGGNPARYIYVNGAKYDEDGSANTTPKGADNKVFVPAGDVELVMKDGEDASKNVQIYQMIFNATPDYTRPVTEGKYGTICLENSGVMTGATLYEVAYYGATSKKIFFDEILNGEMEAGVPYIFLPNEGADKLAVFYTDEANASAGNRNGLIGYIGASEDPSYAVPVPHNEGNYILNNNQYREVVYENSAYVLSHRAYIKLAAINPTEPALAPGRHRISMNVQQAEVATGMDNLYNGEQPMKVMIDGQMYILRGEKMYDATGRLVK